MTQVTAANNWHSTALDCIIFQNWMSVSLYIILKHIFCSNISVLHRFILINLPNVNKQKPYFAASSVWAKLSEMGRALKAFKFATICKVSSDWPCFIVPLGL